MKKLLALVLTMVMVIGLLGSVINAEEVIGVLEVQDFTVEYLAAPAVAGLLLEQAGLDNRYGSGRDGGNYISDVARQMWPGTDFNGVSKDQELQYKCAIAHYLISKGANVQCPCEGILDPVASGATAENNFNGTVTLEITALDLCGNGINGLNPLTDFYVMDSVIGGPFYFGTSSIPNTEIGNWSVLNGVYTITLPRNIFNARPAGYDEGWYRIWDIYVKGELVKDNLIINTTYYAVGDWKMDLYVGSTLYERFVVIETHSEGDIVGFFGVGYDPDGAPTGTITGTITGNSIYFFYERPASFNYTAEFWGTISADGNSMSGTWDPSSGTSGTWSMIRQ